MDKNEKLEQIRIFVNESIQYYNRVLSSYRRIAQAYSNAQTQLERDEKDIYIKFVDLLGLRRHAIYIMSHEVFNRRDAVSGEWMKDKIVHFWRCEIRDRDIALVFICEECGECDTTVHFWLTSEDVLLLEVYDPDKYLTLETLIDKDFEKRKVSVEWTLDEKLKLLSIAMNESGKGYDYLRDKYSAESEIALAGQKLTDDGLRDFMNRISAAIMETD